MGIFNFNGLAPSVISDLAKMSEAAYQGGSAPSGWQQVQGSELGGIFSGTTYSSGGNQAEVFRTGDSITLAFRGTDKYTDVFDYPGLVSNDLMNSFDVLFDALNSYISNDPSITNIYVTGHSLGAGAANSLREESATRGSGIFDAASYVTFSSPTMSSNTNILNIGFENDWVHESIARLVPFGPLDFASSTDHLIWYNELAWFNDDLNIDPRSVVEFFNGADDSPHDAENYIEALDRVFASDFYSLMGRDSIVIVAATALPISAFGPGTTNTVGPVYFLGQSSADIFNGTGFGDFIEGNNGNDILTGFGGNDDIRGGAGLDELWGGTGNDTIDGGTGRDVVYYLDGTSDGAFSGVTVNLSQSGVNVSGGLGNDRLTNIEDVVGSSGNDMLVGNDDNNLLVGVGGNDTLVGHGGNDILMSTGSFGIMIGGSGNDVLEARSQSGRNTGGSGADTFIFSTSGDNHTITDYQDDQDFIMIDTLFAGLFSDLNISQSGSSAIVSIGFLTLTLENTDSQVLDTTDFLLF